MHTAVLLGSLPGHRIPPAARAVPACCVCLWSWAYTRPTVRLVLLQGLVDMCRRCGVGRGLQGAWAELHPGVQRGSPILAHLLVTSPILSGEVAGIPAWTQPCPEQLSSCVHTDSVPWASSVCPAWPVCRQVARRAQGVQVRDVLPPLLYRKPRGLGPQVCPLLASGLPVPLRTCPRCVALLGGYLSARPPHGTIGHGPFPLTFV